MKRHGHLFTQVLAFDNLLQAARRAQRGKRDRLSAARFCFHLETELLVLQQELPVGVSQQRRARQPQRQSRPAPVEHTAAPEGWVYGPCPRAPGHVQVSIPRRRYAGQTVPSHGGW